jgi:hypothetical protein
VPVETARVPEAGAGVDAGGDEAGAVLVADGTGLLLAATGVGGPDDGADTGVGGPPFAGAVGTSPWPPLPPLLLFPLFPLLPLPPEWGPDGPPRTGVPALADEPWAGPPAAPAGGGPCPDPAMTPAAMAPATTTAAAAAATTARGWCRTRPHGAAPGGLTGFGKPWGPNGAARFATLSR